MRSSSDVCACGCGRSLQHHRSQARFFEASCRKKAHTERKRSVVRQRTVSLADQPGYFEALDATRGYLHNWRPNTETQIMLGRAKEILEEFADYLPLTCRQIYYRMVGRYHYPKGKRFEDALYEMLGNARRAKKIEFSDIRDDGIISTGGWWKNPAELLDSWKLQAEGYARDVQQGQRRRVQLWCESTGMIDQLDRIAAPYAVHVHSCGGFNSLTAVRQIVDSCIYDHDEETVLLHLGDCDPSGYSIFQAAVEDAAAFLEEDCPERKFTPVRVAITLDQIDEFNLTADDIKTDDTRSKSWLARGLTRKTELEALDPKAIADLVRKAIEQQLDLAMIEPSREQEQIDRETLGPTFANGRTFWSDYGAVTRHRLWTSSNGGTN